MTNNKTHPLLQPQKIATAISAHLHTYPQNPLQGVTTDSRQDCQNKLFFPLKGENFDGHNYLKNAIMSGASSIICQKNRQISKDIPPSVGVFYVDDCLLAYQNLAKYFRQEFNPTVIAITGSNGKTSTKEFLATIIKDSHKPLVSKGNFNNHIGLPHTLLQITPETKTVILEIGMNHLNEIKNLTSLSDPNIALVTNVGRAHLQGLQKIENIATAKEEIYKYSKKETIKIFNLDNDWTSKMYEHYRSISPTLTFSCFDDKKADVCFQIKNTSLEHLELFGRIQNVKGEAIVPVVGEHHLYNLMAAACASLALEVSPSQIWKKLPKCKGAWGRTQIVILKNKAKVIFDAYNANPDSMKALLNHITKCQISSKLHICLGDMLELGPKSDIFHRLLGQQVAQVVSSMNVGVIAFIGQFGKAFQEGLEAGGVKKSIVLLDKYNSCLADDISSQLQSKDTLIMKASRGIQLEKLLEDLS